MDQRIFVVFLVFLLSCGCQRDEGKQRQFFTGTGVVKSVAADHKSVLVAHDDIPGFMNAMTMEFGVRDAALLANIHPGDEVTFTLELTEDSLYMVALKRTNTQSDAPLQKPS